MSAAPASQHRGENELKAIIAGHEGLLGIAAQQLRALHPVTHHWLECHECNTIERIRRSETGIHGED